MRPGWRERIALPAHRMSLPGDRDDERFPYGDGFACAEDYAQPPTFAAVLPAPPSGEAAVTPAPFWLRRGRIADGLERERRDRGRRPGVAACRCGFGRFGLVPATPQ